MEPSEILGIDVHELEGPPGGWGEAKSRGKAGGSVLVDGRIQAQVEGRGQRALLKSLQQECETRIGDEGTHLARTEDLWVVRAVLERIGWDQVVGIFNIRLRGHN